MGKPSFEGLEQRVKELETECLLLKKSNEILSEKEMESTAFHNALTETVVMVDRENLKFISCNKVAAQRLGKAVEEVIGLSLTDVMSKDELAIRKEHSERVSRTGEASRFQAPLGDRIYDINIYPVFDNDGQVDRLAIYSQDVTDHTRAEKALKESEERYRTLIALSPDAIAVIQDFRFKLANPEFRRLTGYDQDEIDKGLSYNATISKKDRELVHERLMRRLDEKDVFPQRIIMDTITKDGRLIPCESASTNIQYNGQPAVLVIIRDITERQNAERELKKRGEELKEKANDLQEVNAALKVLLKHRDEDKAEVEERVLSNIQTLIMPFLEKLRNKGLDKKQAAYANILETNLKDIVSPFSRRLTLKHLKLTPAEIQISNLIKQGSTSKEIADLLNLSERTIESHRKNIRKKTGIKNKKENLRTHLMNLYDG